MANFIAKDNLRVTVPYSFKRNDPAPIDVTGCFESFDDAKTYSTKNPLAYVGQILIVSDIEGNAKLYKIANTAGDLEEIRTGADAVTAKIKTWTDQTV